MPKIQVSVNLGGVSSDCGYGDIEPLAEYSVEAGERLFTPGPQIPNEVSQIRIPNRVMLSAPADGRTQDVASALRSFQIFWRTAATERLVLRATSSSGSVASHSSSSGFHQS